MSIVDAVKKLVTAEALVATIWDVARHAPDHGTRLLALKMLLQFVTP